MTETLAKTTNAKPMTKGFSPMTGKGPFSMSIQTDGDSTQGEKMKEKVQNNTRSKNEKFQNGTLHARSRK
ncbi:hypothetical protein HMPREF1425_00698 [Helicobacter pylori GAM71Ai]|nr:hypothetical protein HMPREF1425_00698 [Helicobacter pylori GAM71Ai]